MRNDQVGERIELLRSGRILAARIDGEYRCAAFHARDGIAGAVLKDPHVTGRRDIILFEPEPEDAGLPPAFIKAGHRCFGEHNGPFDVFDAFDIRSAAAVPT